MDNKQQLVLLKEVLHLAEKLINQYENMFSYNEISEKDYKKNWDFIIKEVGRMHSFFVDNCKYPHEEVVRDILRGVIEGIEKSEKGGSNEK